MKARVDKEACVGCGLCVSCCEAVFRMVDDVAVAPSGDIDPDDQDACREAAASCPVEAILLEE